MTARCTGHHRRVEDLRRLGRRRCRLVLGPRGSTLGRGLLPAVLLHGLDVSTIATRHACVRVGVWWVDVEVGGNINANGSGLKLFPRTTVVLLFPNSQAPFMASMSVRSQPDMATVFGVRWWTRGWSGAIQRERYKTSV